VELLAIDGGDNIAYNINKINVNENPENVMRLRYPLYLLVLALTAAPAGALLNVKAGYTSTLGELGDRYRGGLGAMVEVEVGLPGPVSIVPMGGYTQLGQDQQFTDLLDQYIGQYWPPGVPLPPQLRDLGDINSSMYFFGAGVRLDAVRNVAARLYGEVGGGYYYRDMEARGVPLSLIATFVPEFDQFAVDPTSGFGVHADFGVELIPFSPIAPQVGAHYMHAFGIGRTTIDDFMAENVPGFRPPTSEDVDLFLFYAGIGIF
jgi:hypothetical protein